MAVTWDSAGAGAVATTGEQLTLDVPPTVNAGDLLIAHICIRVLNRSMAPASGETGWVIWRGPETPGTGRHWVMAKIADGSEGGTTVAFDVLNAGVPDNSTSAPRHGTIHRIVGNATGTITAATNGDVLSGYVHETGSGTTFSDAGVTTDTDGCLAVNLVYCPDDNTFNVPTGQTGGTWVEPVEEFKHTIGSDGAHAIFVAEIATAGTIDGGTSIKGNDPWSTMGFFIKPAAAGGTEVFGAASLTLSASIATVGKKTAYGASESALTASIASAGKKTAYGAASLPLSAGFSTSGGRVVHASASLSLALDLATAGKKTAQGAASLPGTFSFTTAGKKVAHGAAALPLTFDFTTTGTVVGGVIFGAASMPLTFGVTTSGKRIAHGAAALPIVFDTDISGKKHSRGAAALALLASIVTVGSVTSAEVQAALEKSRKRMNNVWRRMASRDISGW